VSSRGARAIVRERTAVRSVTGRTAAGAIAAYTRLTMTSERAQAYGRVMRLLEDLGPSKLLPDEQATVREAADALLFCDGPECADDARSALASVERLADHLVEAERWTRENAHELVIAVEGCGSLELV
jgi:hypothetical protein